MQTILDTDLHRDRVVVVLWHAEKVMFLSFTMSAMRHYIVAQMRYLAWTREECGYARTFRATYEPQFRVDAQVALVLPLDFC